MSLRILGTGSALPQMAVTNHDLMKYLDTDDEWIVSRTGIRERRVCDGESLADLGSAAAQQALEDAGITAGDLDFILCPTLQGDLVTPALACQIQGRIGATCPSVDINSACTGFIYALDMAAAYLAAGKAKRILIVCAEAMSRLVDWQDRSTCILFGDGAGAVVVSQGDALKATFLSTHSDEMMLRSSPDGGNCPFIQKPTKLNRLSMNGQEVYKFAVASSTHDLNEVAKEAKLTLQDIDLFLIHQANLRIIEGVRHRLSLPAEKFPVNIERYGNTSSASIPILLDELNKQNLLLSGQIIAMSAFGAGLSTAACVIVWD